MKFISDIPENKENGLRPSFLVMANRKDINKMQHTVKLLQYPRQETTNILDAHKLQNKKERKKRSTIEHPAVETEKEFQSIVENTTEENKQKPTDLLNDSELKTNIEKVFKPITPYNLENLREPLDQKNFQYSTNPNVLNNTELQANIITVFGTAPLSLSQTKERFHTNNPDSQAMLENDTNEKHKRNTDQDAAKEPPKLNTLILEHFGPEVVSSVDSTSERPQKNEGNLDEHLSPPKNDSG